MSEFIIRSAVPEDAQAMAEVIAAGREQTYGLRPHSWDYDDMVTAMRGERGAASMRDYMTASGGYDFIGEQPRAVVVADRADETAVAGMMGTRDLPEYYDGRARVELDFIFVDPNQQGKGLGRLLMDNLTEYAGNRRQELSVVSHNLRAQRLYEKYGFVAVPGATSGRPPLVFQRMVKPAGS